MSRRRNPKTEEFLEANPQVPVTFTCQLEAHFVHNLIGKFCKENNIYRYELVIASIYSFLRQHDLTPENHLYQNYVDSVMNQVEYSRIRAEEV